MMTLQQRAAEAVQAMQQIESNRQSFADNLNARLECDDVKANDVQGEDGQFFTAEIDGLTIIGRIESGSWQLRAALPEGAMPFDTLAELGELLDGPVNV
jgi:hypothetical protein